MELTVISGKGGTGKTTIAMAIAEMEGEIVKVDCDVDAPNLYLYYSGEDINQEPFSGGKLAVVDPASCNECGMCQTVCEFQAIVNGEVAELRCEGCGACSIICPIKAITMVDEKSADMYITKTPQGILSRAEMEIGSEGSGKLITFLRKRAKEYAGTDEVTVIDGSPGIGCPVISSITATDAILIVTEPTQSGIEDFSRIVTLCQQFNLPAFVCINKADINEEMSDRIEAFSREHNVQLAGRIPYDDTVLQSINELKPIINYHDSPAGEAIREMWKKTKAQLMKDRQKEDGVR